MGADALPLGIKGIGDRAFGRYGVVTVVMQILLMVGGFDVDGGVPLSKSNPATISNICITTVTTQYRPNVLS